MKYFPKGKMKLRFHLTPFHQIRLQNRTIPRINIGFHKINSILKTFHFELFGEFFDLLHVIVFHLIGLQLDGFASFHIDKFIRAIFEFEI